MSRVFGRIGLLSFGGPAAQIAVMHRELVEERPWLEEESFLRGLSFCMLLPGPEAMQLCTYAGWRLRGIPGGLLAGLLFVLPGALVIACLVWLYAHFGTLPGVQAAFLGVKAAVVIIVSQALWRLAGKALKGRRDLMLAAFGFAGLFLFSLPFPLVILSAGLFGLFWPARTAVAAPAEPAIQPANRTNTPVTLLLWSLLWLAPLLLLELSGSDFLADIGWFFAKLAVVSFGGAYAVLSYMSQTVVEQQGWISAREMIDALGLAETTPGPLILVTQFVAMLSGLKSGGFALFLAAGLTALWATFLPCFLWIFAAAPHVETLTRHPRLSGALSAITAVVTGVILNLMVWFTLHVLFHKTATLDLGPFPVVWPKFDSLDVAALILIGLAGLAALLLRGRLLWLLAVMALAGLALVPYVNGL